MHPSAPVLDLARRAGFDLAGIAPLAPPRDAQRFRDWLARGDHAGLEYLARNADRIADPRLVAPHGRSLLVVGLAHSRAAVQLGDGTRVARYAGGRDYHNVVVRMLRRLRRNLIEEGWLDADFHARAISDAGPLLERSHAAEAGLGFASKAANLLHPRFGPWFFLGELVLGAEVEPTTSPPAGSCGTCRACIDACPTRAIVEPGRIDAGLCISYHTIENRGPIPHELRAALGSWGFGCDVCSEVCPWGRDAPDLAERWGTHAEVEGGSAVGWLELPDPAEWKRRMQGSPLQRAGRAGLARNAAIVLGNAPREGAEPALLQALSFDPSALVREAAGWALAHGYGRRDAVERARAAESDDALRAQLRRTLEEAP